MAYTTIKKPSDYFNTVLYTGNGSTNAITGVGFAPDLTLLKDRNDTSGTRSYDTVRGAIKRIRTDTNEAEVDDSDGLTAFGSDGFTLGADGATNGNSTLYVSWNWLGANGTASNTDGSITSTVSANTTNGFSICTFTPSGSGDQSFGHGLGATPKVVITKARTSTSGWNFYHENSYATTPEDYYLSLNATDGITNLSGVWGAGMTSSVAGVGVGVGVTAGLDYVAYCFAEVKGFSKFGSYVGNGSTDGTFIYCGFKPAWVMVKRTGAESWGIIDNKRQIYNPNNTRLFANLTAVEDTSELGIDLLSNGFKIRNSWSGNNASGNSYIYMAFAEEPLVGDNPATAR